MQNVLESLSKADLIALIEQREMLIQQKDFTIQRMDSTIQELGASIQDKETQIAKLQRMLYGQKRERFTKSPIQLPLDFGQQLSQQEIKEIEELINTKAQVHKEDLAKQPRQPHPGRSPLPKHLAVEEIVIEPVEDTTGMVLMGQEVSDSLQYVPSRFYIQRIIRPKYIKPAQSIDQVPSFAIAALPQSAFGKCMAGAGLIAQMLIDKFWDHLPLYRQQQRFKREGIDIAASTIDHWVKLGMQRIELLYEYQKRLVLHSPYLQVDETVIKVQDHQNKSGKTHQGYFWAYHDPVGKQTFFKYEPTRAGAYPTAMLKDFTGYLQTDGYGGYGAVAQRENIVHLACWAHTRRKFEEALSHDKVMAETAMVLIQELYAVERQAKDQNRSGGRLDIDQIKELRLEKSLPKYNLLGKWISSNMPKVLPKSPIGAAFRYAFERWDELGHYMYDGRLQIDNNWVENAIRPIAIGRKNFLFAGSHEGAQRAAIMYTFADQCKRHNQDPHQWLKHVFENILDTKPSQYHSLLPQNHISQRF